MRIPSPYISGGPKVDYGEMTPMIDVVFQLLIFFVVAATGQVAEAFLPTNLPPDGAQASVVAPSERELWADEVWIHLLRDPGDQRTVADLNGTIYEELPKLRSVLLELGDISRDNPVILEIAGSVPVGDAVYVFDTCRAAGFESVSFAADAPDG